MSDGLSRPYRAPANGHAAEGPGAMLHREPREGRERIFVMAGTIGIIG
jgi:hypothetical protein